jgi:hypothetical protein
MAQGTETPAIHSKLNRVFCASAGTVGDRPLDAQMAVQTKIPPIFSAPSCSQCGTQMMIIRISRDWPTYIQRTYQCPWCPHRTSEVVGSPMPTDAIDHVAH